MLIDSVEVTLRAGKGGDGIVSWRREKYVPKGGPDGGDGGRGGDVILRTSTNLDTLSSFRYRKVFQAEDGERGQAKKMSGRAGEGLELLVPVGTVIFDIDTGQVLADLTTPDQVLVIAKGGKGGQGNVHFATATHQRPSEFTAGQPGQTKKVRLELRLIADVALIGEPNAGKSSLISALTGVESRIGSYAFSTTEPILGVMKKGEHVLTLVDLPGLLAGAHQGQGLGDKFLQHAERVKGLVQVVDATSDIAQSLDTLTQEISQYSASLAERPRLIVINKVDLLRPDELDEINRHYPQAVLTSATKRQGLDELKRQIIDLVTITN